MPAAPLAEPGSCGRLRRSLGSWISSAAQPRSAGFSRRAEPGSPRTGRLAGLRRRQAPGARFASPGGRHPGRAAPSTTTHRSNAGRSTASPSPCSTRSPAPWSWTRPNVPTCSTCIAASPPVRSDPGRGGPRPSGRWCNAWSTPMTVPAFVRNARHDFVCGNQLAYAFYAPLYPDPQHPDPSQPVNFVRFCFLDPLARGVLPGLGNSWPTPP